MHKTLFCLSLIFFITSCKKKVKEIKPISVLQEVAASTDSILNIPLSNPEKYKIQILFSRVYEKKDGSILFEKEDLGLNNSNYFYPASTVKLPIALLALEKIQKSSYSYTTPFFVEGDSMTTTIKDEINKIFAVSDNEAFNRLFEYLGTDYINKQLQEKKLTPSRICHRLSVNNADDRVSKAVIFTNDEDTLFNSGTQINNQVQRLNLKNTEIGIAYYDDEDLIEEPKNFNQKNYYSLVAMHKTLQKLFYPEAFSGEENFNLNNEHLDFIKQSMSDLPRTMGYDEVTYHDSYVKFFIYGDQKERIPEHIKIYNKVGMAYGFLIDNAYIHDELNDIKFFLTATIYVNENNTLNDDHYEYDEIGFPFLARLGRAVYEYELKK
ncbi:MAG: serine hydrolase [Flavobacteriaceae bacterium]|nr:serine hydrolase [Flavobacteriaceae bacterium]